MKECTSQLRAGHRHISLGIHVYAYIAGATPDHVHLVLVPRPELTGGTWDKVADAISFVQSYLEYKESQFTTMWKLSPGQVRV